jgi:hypothetical protein
MRLLQTSLIGAALLASVTAAHAQSAYDYPWCGIYDSNAGAGGAQACYYTSYAQCMATMRGLGFCTESPYYGHGPRSDRPQRRRDRNY